MKPTIKSLFSLAAIALVITGCQKQSDDPSVLLKSRTIFSGGYYESIWTSGNAASECALAGGCSGGSYKIDGDVYGEYGSISYNEGGVTVVGKSSTSFDWTSAYPVCRIIVKAGRGAYIFDVGGATSGTIVYPEIDGVKPKAVSHVTFCFSDLIVAVKTWFVNEEGGHSWAISTGALLPEFTGQWCNDYLGITAIPTEATIDLVRGWSWNNIGGFTITSEGFVTVTLTPGFNIANVYIFVGTIEELIETVVDGCPNYEGYEDPDNYWQFFDADSNSNVFSFQITI